MAFDLVKIQKDIRKLRRFLKRAPKHTTPKKVHSLRTAIRRFEAAMQALALDSNANERPLLRKLAKLRKRAGKVRDLDVLTGHVAKSSKIGGEEECLVQLLEYLGAEHARRSQRLYCFAVQHGKSLRRRLKRIGNELRTSSESIELHRASPGYTMLSELRLQRELTAPIRLTRKNLHPYRLKVKELRYILQMENHPFDQPLIETLGEMKDAMGEWHDWQELQAIAGEQLPHGSKCKLISLFQDTADQKLKRALAVANEGRKRIQSTEAGTDGNA